jgi:hypothetical protein
LLALDTNASNPGWCLLTLIRPWTIFPLLRPASMISGLQWSSKICQDAEVGSYGDFKHGFSSTRRVTGLFSFQFHGFLNQPQVLNLQAGLPDFSWYVQHSKTGKIYETTAKYCKIHLATLLASSELFANSYDYILFKLIIKI